LGTGSRPSWRSWTDAFVERLRELGWIEGRTVTIEYRWAEGHDARFAAIASDFVRLKVDVIVSTGAALFPAKQATSAIPIVFAIAADPVGSGLVASLAQPGGNVTGLSLQQTDTGDLDLLSRDAEVLAEVAAGAPHSPPTGQRLPPVLWALLLVDLEPYLGGYPADGVALYGFYHRQLAEAVRDRYLTGPDRHRALAAYFGEQPLWLGADVPNTRKLREMPYQQAYGECWAELYATLSDLGFLEAKAGIADGVHELEQDLDRAVQRWPAESGFTSSGSAGPGSAP